LLFFKAVYDYNIFVIATAAIFVLSIFGMVFQIFKNYKNKNLK
jgi:hypothetical protein